MITRHVQSIVGVRGLVTFGDVCVGPLHLISLLFLCAALAAIGQAEAVGATVPAFSNVLIVLEENHSYAEVVGNTTQAPYLNQLINLYGVATNYYANTHPSLPNYLWLTSGSNDGVSGDPCEDPSLGGTGPLNVDNIVRELNAANLSWKAYEEDLPYAGYMRCDTGEYAQKHDPFAYYSDVVNSATQQQNIVPFSQFATDLAAGTLPIET